jgi:hypothetical protein
VSHIYPSPRQTANSPASRRFSIQTDQSLNQKTVLATTIAPMSQHLPESVLRLIFDYSIQGPVALPPPIDDQRRVLTRVCQDWRDIIVDTPTYWDCFDFKPQTVQPKDLLRLAKCFFGHSDDTIPLSVSFRGSLQSNDERNVFEFVIRPRAHRIRFFSCSIRKETLRILFGRDPVPFPVLQVIDVAVIYDLNGTIASRMPVSGSIDLSGFQRAPRLRDATLRILGGIHPTDLKIPWGQLTRIDLEHTCVLVHTFMKAMKECVLLEDGAFCINFARYYDGQPLRLRRISIPRLRCLRLRLVKPSLDARMFASLHIPLLEELEVERDEVGQTIRDMTIYETLLAGANANIKRVTISEHAIPTTRWFLPWLNRQIMHQRLDGVLRSCDHLTSLFLCPGVFIHRLMLDKLATGEFIPRLEEFGVSSVYGWDIIWMVQRKNLASTFPDSGPSLSPAARPTRPVALNYLHLSTMGCGPAKANAQELEDAATALDLARGYMIQHIDIGDECNH